VIIIIKGGYKMEKGGKRRSPDEMFEQKDLAALRLVSRSLYRKISKALEENKPSYELILERQRIVNFIDLLEKEIAYNKKK
jgi:hypothetical protein